METDIGHTITTQRVDDGMNIILYNWSNLAIKQLESELDEIGGVLNIGRTNRGYYLKFRYDWGDGKKYWKVAGHVDTALRVVAASHQIGRLLGKKPSEVL